MKHPMSVIVAAGALLALPACQPLRTADDGRFQGKGPLVVEPSPSPDAIPASYGRPFTVTAHPTNPNLVYIWFVRDDQSIVAVRVENNAVVDATTIPRK